MNKGLTLLVRFNALDKLSKPLDAIARGSNKAAAAVSKARGEVRALQAAQGRISGFRKAEQQYGESARKIELLRQKTANLRTAIDTTGKSTTGLANRLRSAERKEADAIAKHEVHGRKLEELSRDLTAAGHDVDNLSDHESRLADKLSLANRQLSEQKQKLERVQQATDKLERTRERGANIRSAGYGAVTAGAAIGAPLALASRSAAKFQSQMTDIGQKAGLTRQQTAAMGREFDRMGPKVAQLPSKLAEGVDVLMGMGASKDQALAAINPIGKAATAWNAEIVDLSAATFASLDNLKIKSSETAKTLDIMGAASKAGAFEVKDMAQHFPALTASANALGMKGTAAVADLSAALQIARKGAGDSGQAANNLQNLMNKINTEDTIKRFKKFGIDVPAALKKAAADGRSPIETMTELTQKATGGDLSKLSFLFGDAQVQAAMRPMVKNIDLYRKIRADAMNAQGTVERDFADRMNDSATKADRLGATAESVGHRIGGVLLPTISKARDMASAMSDRIIVWADANPKLANTLIMIVAAIAGLLITFGGLAIAIGAVLTPFAYLRFAISGAMPILSKLPMVFGVVRTAAMFLAKGVMRAGLMLLANPMVLAIVAIVAVVGLLAYAIYSNWDAIKAAFSTGIAWLQAKWAQFKQMFFGAVAFVLGLRASFIQAGGDLITGLINGFMGKVGALKNKIIQVATNVKNWFADKLGIHSPSRVFMALGGNVTEGLDRGLGQGEKGPLRRIRDLAGAMTAALVVGTATPALATGGIGSTAAGSARLGAAPAPHVTFNIYQQPGQSAEDVADAVGKALERWQKKQDAAARSSFQDDEDV